MLITECVLENEGENYLGFGDANGSLNPNQNVRSTVYLKEEKRTCHLVNFTVRLDYRVKMRESEKIDKYVDLGRELKSCET